MSLQELMILMAQWHSLSLSSVSSGSSQSPMIAAPAHIA